jgi:RNA polymerase sigma-70 factor (ECF subfamily)
VTPDAAPAHDAASHDALRRAQFEELARRVWVPLHQYARRRAAPADADDVVSETLAVLWRRFADVPAGAELPWAYQVARRCLANHRRGEHRRRSLADRVRREPSYPVAADHPLAGGVLDATLDRALATLSADDREIVRLWAWEQLEPREIAVVLDVSANTASARLSRARRKLADFLGAGHDDAGAGHMTGEAPKEHRS